MSKGKGFTLIELLVVISIIALLIAIFIPVLGSARELGQRAVCLSNLKQLTLAWILYAEENDGKLVDGDAFGRAQSGNRVLESWLGRAFLYPQNRSELIENPDKGALWPWIQDVDIYRCPRGLAGHAVTYTPVVSANGQWVEGTFIGTGKRIGPVFDHLEVPGKRIGRTVLRLTRLTDIVSPSAGQRAVFIDIGQISLNAFEVDYLYPKWKWHSPPPKHHHDGVTLSMADGHAEYWKWKGRETLNMPRMLQPNRYNPNLYDEWLAGPADYEPQTEDGLYDLQRLQRATWGRLGYTLEGGP